MINTIFHFVNDPTFDYQTAVNNGDISEYTIVFNSADHSIHCKGAMFGRMSRADIAETLGNISDLIPVATDSTLGGIKIGYTNNADLNSRRYGVVLDDNNKAYVEVPWTDTITPDFDDTELKNLIATERSRIDNFISTLSTTIDAKNRQLFADTQWVEEVFGIPQAEGSIWQKFENEIDHYLNEYMVWDWVDPEDHTKGRTAKISSIELDIDGITTRVGTAEEWMEDAGDLFEGIDGDITVLQEQSSTLSQTAQAIDLRVQEVESWNVAPDGIIVSNTTRIGNVETKAGAVELRAGQLETRMTDAEGRLTSTDIALSDLELSVNGYYSVSLVSAVSGAIEISTIARDASKFDSLSEGQHINDKLFSHFPVQTSVYKNSTQYFKFTRVDGAVDSLASLSSSVTSYNGTNDDNLANIIKMAASVLDLKTSSDAQGLLTSTADLASVITNGSFSGYSGLASKVSEIDGAYVSQASLTSQIQALDVSGQIATATSGLASESYVRTTAASEADDAESAAKGYADTVAASATATMYATVDAVCAGIGVTVTKNQDGSYDSVASIDADNINLNGQTNFKTAVGAFIKTDVLEAGVATVKANLTVGGSDPSGGGTAGTITMKNASDTTVGVWDKSKFAVGTTSSPATNNSAMLVNADGSGSLSKGNISWNANGDVSVNGTGQFNGDVYANQFRAGGTSSFNITVESDAINFNYGDTRQAWFSTKKLEMNSNGEIVDTGNDAPQGFYLYMISPRTGNLVTIDFESGMFVEVTNGTVTVHTDSNTVKEISAGSSGSASVSNKTVYYTTDTSGSTPVNTYYWDSECTNQISGNLSDASHNYYIVVGNKYVVVNEDTGTGRSPYMLRRVTIYQPVKYDGSAHRLIPYGDRVYVIDKGTVSAPNRYFVISMASTAATLYNTSVYMENTTTTLDNMHSNMKLTSGSGSLQVYVATKSAGSSIPALTNTISIFTPGSGTSSVMTKVDYTVS